VARSTLRADAALREYLHREARAFMLQMINTLLELGPEGGQYAHNQLHARVDAIAAGEAITLSRYQLPPDHPQAAPHGGHPCDDLLLDEHDVLRPIPSYQDGYVRR
jgi:hypothetical protein